VSDTETNDNQHEELPAQESAEEAVAGAPQPEDDDAGASGFSAWAAGNPVLAAVAGVAAAALVLLAFGLLLAAATTDTTAASEAALAFAPGLDEADSFVEELFSEESSPTTAAALLSASTKASPEAAPPAPPTEPTTELYAFYVNWGDEAYESLEANIDHIDVLVPMWYHVDSNGNVTVDDPAKQAQAMALIKSRNPDMKVMPLVNNYDKSREQWNAPAVAKMLKDPTKRAEIAQEIVDTLDGAGFDGVNIDFENFTADDKAALIAFMEELYPRAKKAGLTVSMDVIVAGSAYDHAELAQHVDFMVPMMYDEHWKTSPAGPISSQPWFERALQRFYTMVPPEKVVVGLGVYTYDYGKSGKRASSLTWQDAVDLARTEDKVIELDPTQKNAHYTYKNGSTTHNVWMLDAVSAYNQMKYATSTGARGFAYWRLGAEDPGLWKVIPERATLDAEVAATLNSSNRKVTYDESSGLIVGETFTP
jgi:spore germination protein YaaH